MASTKKTSKPKSKMVLKAEPKLDSAVPVRPGLAFEIKLGGECERPRSAGPGRLRQCADKPQLTLQDVEEKLRRAEERRKAKEAEKMQKIHLTEEACRKVTKRVDKALHITDTSPSTETSRPFDEDEIVPALRNKLDKSTPTNSKSQGNKKPVSKSGGRGQKNVLKL